MSDNRPFISTKRAAWMLDLSPETIRRWLRSGELAGVKFRNRYLIPVEAIEQLGRVTLHVREQSNGNF